MEYEDVIRPKVEEAVTVAVVGSHNNSLSHSPTPTVFQNTIHDAKLTPAEINKVLLVGGSSYIPLVADMLGELFPHINIRGAVNKNEAVARGAAIYGAQLSRLTREQMPNIVLVEATPLSLGVSYSEDRYRKVIEKNSNVPTSGEAYFCTTVNNQRSFLFKLYEGERRLASENSFLGQFVLDIQDLPSAKAGGVRCRLTFNLDNNGVLLATAECLSEDGAQVLQQATFNVDYNEVRSAKGSIEEMLEQARLHDEEDGVEFLRRTARSDLNDRIQKLRWEFGQVGWDSLGLLHSARHG